MDYISFVGLFVHYLKALNPPIPINRTNELTNNALSPIQSAFPVPDDGFQRHTSRTMIILGGYSYGSFVASYLAPIETIIAQFMSTRPGTAEAEIVLRAQRLASQWNEEAVQQIKMRRGRSLRAHSSMRSSSHSISMGGEETEPGLRRSSRDSRRSMESVRKSMDQSRNRLGLSSYYSEHEAVTPPLEGSHHLVEADIPQTCYLLISPLLPPISMLATMFTKLKLLQKENNHSTQTADPKALTSSSCSQDNLTANPTLAVWGSNDFFTSNKKLRKWAEQLAQKAASRFMYHEIFGAGHFWHEEGAEARMTDTIGKWIDGIIKDAG